MAEGSTKAIANQKESFEAIVPKSGTSQKLNISASSVQGSAFTAGTTLIRLFATNDCYIDTGSNPTALADGTSMFIPGGITEYIGVQPGQKLAVIQFSQNGLLFVTEAA